MSELESADAVVVALRDLLSSEGWRVFRDAATASWGPQGYGLEMQRALSSVPPGPDRAYQIAEIAERVEATAQAVNALIAWPTEEIKRRTETKAPARPFRLPRMSR